MSKIALSGDASGTGTFTIASPNSNSNFTLSLPTESGTLTTTASTPTFTGAVTAPAFIPNSSTIPTNGVFLPAANTVGFSTNSTERMRLDSSGSLGIGTTSLSSISGTVRTLSLGGTNANTSGGVAYQANGTVKAYHYVDNNVLRHESLAGGQQFTASNATAMTIASNGNLNLTYNLGIGNATATTSGYGITFPATQSASSDANTLDDYEEGNWTPGVGGYNASPTVTYTSQSGSYTKIGRQVTAAFKIVVNTVSGTGIGSIIITALPFTSNGEFVASLLTSGVDFGTSATQLTGRTEGSTWIRLYGMLNNGALADTNSNNVASGDVFQGVITYFV